MKKITMSFLTCSLLLIGCSGEESSEEKVSPFQAKVDEVCGCFEKNKDDFLAFNEECGEFAEGMIDSFEDEQKKNEFVEKIMECKREFQP